MANNKLSDLNNHLFAQLERLSEENIAPDKLKEEISRAKAINGVAKSIIDNARTALEGAVFAYEKLPSQNLPGQFEPKQNVISNE